MVVIAASGASAAFAETAHLPLRLIRGQLTLVPATPASRALRSVLCGEGYIAPALDGAHSLGATHKFRDTSTGVTAAEHAENLAQARRASRPHSTPRSAATACDPARLAGRAALRCSSPDYLPIIGPVVDAIALRRRYARLSHDATLRARCAVALARRAVREHRARLARPRHRAASGELLAAYLDDEPAPLPASVEEAVHPSRFLLRSLIRRRR